MVRRRTRLASALLAGQIAMIVTGCGQAPAPAAAPALAPAHSAAAPAAKALAPTVAVTSQQAPAIALSPREVVEGPQAAATVAAKPRGAGLFDHNFDKTSLYQSDLGGEDAQELAAVQQEVTAQGPAVGPIAGPWGIIGGIGAGLLGASAISYAIYTGMIGSRDLMHPEQTELRKTPGSYGVPYEKFNFESHDGLRLAAWYVPAEVPTTKGIVVFHGHGSNMDRAFEKYGMMLHHDYNLFLYDSRYHSESEGKFTTLGYYERKDALIAIEKLRARNNTKVAVMGESMGGAVAIEAGAMDPSVVAVWADCAFDSLHDAIAPRAVKRGYPLPDYVAWSVTTTASIRAKGKLTDADPIKWVDKISPRPLYLIHGQADDDTTPMNSDKLYDKAGEPKTIWRTEGAKHAESWEKYPVEYRTRMQAFFHQYL